MASSEDHRLAHELAEDAGRRLRRLRREHDEAGIPVWQRRDDGDRIADDLLLRRLHEERPDDAILSEEGRGEKGPEGSRRLDAERVWIVDPLDGTREYGEIGRDDWAVHVALVEKGQPTAAAVALPGRDLVLSTAAVPPIPPTPPARPRIVVSRSRPPQVAHHLAEQLGADLIPMGSAGAKTAAVVLGEADIYAHAGGQYEWDSCAPVGVARAAGCFTARLDLGPLSYNRPDPWLPDLIVTHPRLEDDVRRVLGSWAGPAW